MAVDLLQYRSLTELVNKQKSPYTWLADRYFSNSRQHYTNKVDFEIVTGTDRMARFINPGEPSRTVKNRGKVVKTFRIEEVAENKFFTANELFLTRGLGDGTMYINSAAELQQNRNRVIADASQELRDRIMRLKEWMASQALQGKIEVRQDNIAVDFDFGFVDGTHKKTFVGGDSAWDDATPAVDKITQILQLRRGVQATSGLNPSDVIMGTGSASKWMADPVVREYLHNNNLRVGQMDLNGNLQGPVTYFGNILGMNFFEYTQTYTDSEGVVRQMWPTNQIMLIAPNSNYRTHYAPIIRDEEGVQAVSLFARQWAEKNPSGRYIEVASAFLMCVHDPDSQVIVTTHTA